MRQLCNLLQPIVWFFFTIMRWTADRIHSFIYPRIPIVCTSRPSRSHTKFQTLIIHYVPLRFTPSHPYRSYFLDDPSQPATCTVQDGAFSVILLCQFFMPVSSIFCFRFCSRWLFLLSTPNALQVFRRPQPPLWPRLIVDTQRKGLVDRRGA